jgi:hypothetical protein
VDYSTLPRSAYVKPNVSLLKGVFGVTPHPLGRLVQLKEAASKVRTIAIVDPITNWVLSPIHDWIFKSILPRIEQDGTFDQDAPIIRLRKIIRKRSDKFLGSCDLSAATDRLPVSLQVLLLSYPFGHEFAKAWAQVLVNRPYKAGSKNFWYSVGQPMGALSS